MPMQNARLGARLQAARERAGLTQEALARELGLPHRQTLASIEAGQRRLSAEELLAAVRVLRVDLDYFTDAFRLVGEGRFSFRAHGAVTPGLLDEFQERAGRWIATYRELSAQQGEPFELLESKLALSPRSTFEEAQAAAESVARWLELGSIPAADLTAAMERHLGALVLNVDAPGGISGAASQVPGLSTVLVNRGEPPGRRNYDKAHELFHLLTWDAMKPARIEPRDPPTSGKGNRVEQLADNFAAALLMPAGEMQARWSARNPDEDVHDWLRMLAAEFEVSAVACKWRLYGLGCISRAALTDINDQRLAMSPRDDVPAPPLFSEPFVRRIAVALDGGRLSVRRAASLLGVPLLQLAELLQSYGFEPSFEV